MNPLSPYIESLIFVSDSSISKDDIKSCLQAHFEHEVSIADIDQALESLIIKYQNDDFSIEIVEISGGFRFMTKGAYHPIIATHLKQITNKKLSKSAMETLSIIAYKQPVEKSEVEMIRGVNCDYSIDKLLQKELVEILGRSDGPGRPLLYGTSEKFMDYFGLKSIQDLPKVRDLEIPENAIGEEVIEENISSVEEE